jgi:hypothetical protein
MRASPLPEQKDRSSVSKSLKTGLLCQNCLTSYALRTRRGTKHQSVTWVCLA